MKLTTADVLIGRKLRGGITEADVDAFRKIADSGMPGRVAGVSYPVDPEMARAVMRYYDKASPEQRDSILKQSHPAGLVNAAGGARKLRLAATGGSIGKAPSGTGFRPASALQGSRKISAQ